MSLSIASFVVCLVLLQRLRKFARGNTLPALERLFTIAFFFSIFLFVMEATLRTGNITKWIWHLFLFAIIIFSLRQEPLRILRMSIYAFVPFVIISLLTNIA